MLPAVALADRNNLFGAMEFSGDCAAAGVQPIIGALVAVERPGSRTPAGTDDVRLAGTARAGQDRLRQSDRRWCQRRASRDRRRRRAAPDARRARPGERPGCSRLPRGRRGRSPGCSRRGRTRPPMPTRSSTCFPAGCTSNSAAAATRVEDRAEAGLIALAQDARRAARRDQPGPLRRRRASTRRTTSCCVSPTARMSKPPSAAGRTPSTGSSPRR